MPRKRGRRITSRRTKTRSRARRNVSRSIQSNIRIVLTNLIVFAVLFLISLILWSLLQSNITLQNLFFVFAMGFGVISVAFLITLVVFLFMKLFQKK
jgi:K+-sensing histidine kinase KdpD